MYNIYDHIFEIIYKCFYINIRVNTLESLELNVKYHLIDHITEIILSIEENTL